MPKKGNIMSRHKLINTLYYAQCTVQSSSVPPRLVLLRLFGGKYVCLRRVGSSLKRRSRPSTGLGSQEPNRGTGFFFKTPGRGPAGTHPRGRGRSGVPPPGRRGLSRGNQKNRGQKLDQKKLRPDVKGRGGVTPPGVGVGPDPPTPY